MVDGVFYHNEAILEHGSNSDLEVPFCQSASLNFPEAGFDGIRLSWFHLYGMHDGCAGELDARHGTCFQMAVFSVSDSLRTHFGFTRNEAADMCIAETGKIAVNCYGTDCLGTVKACKL